MCYQKRTLPPFGRFLNTENLIVWTFGPRIWQFSQIDTSQWNYKGANFFFAFLLLIIPRRKFRCCSYLRFVHLWLSVVCLWYSVKTLLSGKTNPRRLPRHLEHFQRELLWLNFPMIWLWNRYTAQLHKKRWKYCDIFCKFFYLLLHGRVLLILWCLWIFLNNLLR